MEEEDTRNRNTNASVLGALQAATSGIATSGSNFGSESSQWSLASIDSFRFPSSELSDGDGTPTTEHNSASEQDTAPQRTSPCAGKSKGIPLGDSRIRDPGPNKFKTDKQVSANRQLTPEKVNCTAPTPSSPQVYRMAADRTRLAQLGFEFRYVETSSSVQNLRKAYDYYEAAAKTGCPDSLVANAVAQIFGIGVRPQPGKARDMLRQAMLQGSVEALEIRALCWMDGTFGERSYASCLNLLAMGIARNSLTCLLWSGFCFEVGLGMECDADTAKQAYLAAADSPSLRSIVMSSFPGALSTGDPWMLLKITLFLLHTDARIPNRPHVMDCLTKAAALGLRDAQVYLAICLIRGTWLKRNPTVARQWLEKAASGRFPHPVACRLLGNMD